MTTYKIKGETLELYPGSAKAAQWIAKYITTNIGRVIFFSREYGLKIVSLMKQDGIRISED